MTGSKWNYKYINFIDGVNGFRIDLEILLLE